MQEGSVMVYHLTLELKKKKRLYLSRNALLHHAQALTPTTERTPK